MFKSKVVDASRYDRLGVSLITKGALAIRRTVEACIGWVGGGTSILYPWK